MALPRIQTLYYYCNDVEPLRTFYIDLLGLEETFYRKDEEAGWFTFVIDEVNVVFVRARTPLPVPAAFAGQAGFAGGVLEQHSWVLQVAIGDFDAVVARLQAAHVPALTDEPTEPQPGHRQFVVRDPMGFTIELYAAPEENGSRPG